MAVQRTSGMAPSQRHMGPPSFNSIPQPVEIDLNRPPGPYGPWGVTGYPVGPLEDPNSPFPSNGSPVKIVQSPSNYGLRAALDPMQTWYIEQDGPWLPKGAVPEAAQEERYHSRGQAHPYRPNGYPPQVVGHRRQRNPSDNGSVHYGVPPPSDSGYGTRMSLETASVRSYDLANTLDSRGITDREMDVSSYGDNRPLRESLESNVWVGAPAGIELSEATPGLHCQTCKKDVKTRSEMKKHDLRHRKPFHCPVKDCSRIGGYSTANDLERHVNSKHAESLPGGRPPKIYSCLVERCKSKDKAWPRLDNFRSHLKRMHKQLTDDEIDYYVRRNDTEHQPPTVVRQEGQMDSAFGTPDNGINLPRFSQNGANSELERDHIQWNAEEPEQFCRPEPLIDPSLVDTSVKQVFVLPTEAHGVGSDQTRDLGRHEVHEVKLQIQPQGTNGCLENETRHSTSDTPGEPQTSILSETKSLPKSIISEEIGEKGKTTKRGTNSTADADAREAIKAVLKAQKARSAGPSHSPQGSPGSLMSGSSDVAPVTAISRPGDINGPSLPSLSVVPGISDDCTPSPKEDNEASLVNVILEAIKNAGVIFKKEPKSTGVIGNSPSGSTTKKIENIVECKECTKFSGRPCELKKHMKRHQRPYGCTFPKCKKKFGSKNDWKRHESSQHYQSELWCCDNLGCSKVFHQAAAFKTHLAETHKIDDVTEIDRRASVRRIGPNSQAHFWCGFCNDVVNLNEKGVDAWTERFNHIDDHFMGRNGNEKHSISTWVHPDDEANEGVQVSPKDISDNSTSSSSSSSGSPPKSDSSSHGSVSAKAKRARDVSSDEPPAKRPKYKYERLVVCCQCPAQACAAKLYESCIDCSHMFCQGCERQVQSERIDFQ